MSTMDVRLVCESFIQCAGRKLEMRKSVVFRLISLCMLIAAIIFIACVLSNPGLGHAIYIGNLALGVDTWRICYAIYAFVMVGLFVGSFFVKEK